ncbi:MAG TPA: ATP-dependent DNA helicase UvrD2 [Acidimicrobiales bacterium]|nr:ATP-dependent DNA helicase UvrD2 [Acidimicrobiales bacterium]
MDPARLLEGLTPVQAEAVATEAAPLRVLAGPGSGKTRVLTRRIAHRVATGSADAGHVLALTFTRKAAGELRSRLGRLGVRGTVVAGTFHAVAYATLRRDEADAGRQAPALLTRKAGVLAGLVDRRGLGGAVRPGEVAAEIEWAKARLVGPEGYVEAAAAAGRRPPVEVGEVAALYRGYEDEKRRRGQVDFDDLLLRCARRLEADPEAAARQRWRFRHLFVDEFQDVNPLQARLLDAWRGDRPDLCVVGDPDQAIYAWNGADAGLLLDFPRHFPGGQTVVLADNFRSTPQVLAVAGAVLGPRAAGAGPLRPAREAGAVPTVRRYADAAAEAHGIARAVERRHRDGLAWSAMAVLVRTHAQSVVLEEALAAAGVPHRVRSGPPFLRQPVVVGALEELARRPGRLAPRLVDLEEDLRDAGEGADTGADDAESARRGLLAELVRLGREYEALDPAAGTEGFLDWLATALRADDGPSPAGLVEVATFHAAKGLEWPVVFVAGLERGLVPVGHARPGPATDEEQRLLYVALTRAAEELHCSWAAERRFGDRAVEREPSPWLADVEAAVAALEAAAAQGIDWRTALAEGRRRLRAARDPSAADATAASGARRLRDAADPQLVAALEAWRSAAARAAGVPRHLVLHDATLAAVAEARPRDHQALLALPGVGPVKADRYGDDLLSVVGQARAS